MASLKFSILIPTRERAQTLGPCLETCLAQDYPNLEILVSDNASSPETRTVVELFKDARLKYFRQDRRISMRQNFEFLVGKASGDYIIMIGDDDGIMPRSIRKMAEYLTKNPIDVLNWTSIVYYWPNRLIKDKGIIHFKYQKIFGSMKKIDLTDRMRGFCSGRFGNYMSGCNIYHGCVSRRVLDAVKSASGRVFSDHMPDVYACVTFPFVAESMVYLDHPLTISGVSLASNGFSFFADKGGEGGEAVPSPHHKFADEANLDPDVERPYNPDLRASQYYAARGLILAKRYLRHQHTINLDAWADIIVREAAQYCNIHSILHTLDPDFDLDARIIHRIGADKNGLQMRKPIRDPARKLKEKFNRMHVDAHLGGRDNVMSAFHVLDRLLPDRAIKKSPPMFRFFNWLHLRRQRAELDVLRRSP